MDINYELYKVFYHVATTLSFSEASRQLYISQSAVSQSVKTLEKKLGTPLFIRSTKSVQLTPEGETLHRHIEPAIQLIRQGEINLMEAGSLGGGQLRIGATDTICRYLLIPYLNQYHKLYPKVHIRIINQTSLKCVDLLESGQVDLIVTNYPNSRMGNREQLQVISEFHDVFTASRSHYPQLENRRVSLKEIQNYPILMLARHSTTNEFLHQMFRKEQLELIPEIVKRIMELEKSEKEADILADRLACHNPNCDCGFDVKYWRKWAKEAGGMTFFQKEQRKQADWLASVCHATHKQGLCPANVSPSFWCPLGDDGSCENVTGDDWLAVLKRVEEKKK